MQRSNYFLVTVSDMESESGRVDAIDVLKYRLNNSIWGSYKDSKGVNYLTEKSRTVNLTRKFELKRKIVENVIQDTIIEFYASKGGNR